MTSEQFSRPGAVDLSQLSLQASAPAGGTGGHYVLDLTEAEFEAVASRSMQHPVLIEFHSPRDTQGAAVAEALAEAVNAAQGKFLLARVDVDAQPRIAQGLGVQAVPTVVALLGGQIAPLFQGTKGAEEIRMILDQVSQAAVANGITGRAEPVSGGHAAGEDAPTPSSDPRFADADAALEAGDFAKAVEEFDKLLQETPSDSEVLAGRAQAALLLRSTEFDPAQVVADAQNTEDLAAQLAAADLEIIQGAAEAGLERLLDFAATASAEDKETLRVRMLELFEVVGRADPVVLRARRRLATVLF